MQLLRTPAELAGRVLLALIFILSGASKLGSIGGVVAYLQSAGLPVELAYPTAVFELAAGIAIAVGYQTRAVAVLLAGFCVVTAAIFHLNPDDQIQQILFLKNLAMAGGFLVLAAAGAGPLSIDARRS